MIDISNIDIKNLKYEAKIENGILYYYINGIKIDKYDLLAAAANEHSVETAFEIIDVADHLFGMLSDYSYISLRNCVYENIVRHECSKTELYYQSVFKNNVKEILGDEYEIIKKSSDNKNIPDAWVSYSGEIIPVEMKIQEFDKKALKQLLRYMSKYETKHGIAIGERLTVDLPNNIVFVEMSVVKRFDKNK